MRSRQGFPSRTTLFESEILSSATHPPDRRKGVSVTNSEPPTDLQGSDLKLCVEADSTDVPPNYPPALKVKERLYSSTRLQSKVNSPYPAAPLSLYKKATECPGTLPIPSYAPIAIPKSLSDCRSHNECLDFRKLHCCSYCSYRRRRPDLLR